MELIPFTLSGSNLSESGLDHGKLLENLNLASDVYIDSVNGAPFGESTIKLFKEAKDEYAKYLQSRRSKPSYFSSWFRKGKSKFEAR